jgi:hypothetical protein
MHSRATVTAALEMSRSGASSVEIGAALGLPSRTVRDWLRGSLPHAADPTVCDRCLGQHDFDALPAEYVYLLGLYLGDGCLSHHAREVYKLRIILDARYPEIVTSARDAAHLVAGKAAAYVRTDHCVEVFSYWRQWICHLPQHGQGLKHERPIFLATWQQRLVERWPEQLLRGLIQSDGCRFTNTGRGGWSQPRYAFSNHSADIHTIFRAACERLELCWTAAKPYTTYVSRGADVARLDQFIGPKR